MEKENKIEVKHGSVNMVDLLTQEQIEFKKAMIEELGHTLYCKQDKFDLSNPFEVAKAVVEEGYYKVPEGAAVLTEDTAEDVANMILNSSQLKETMDRLIKDWQKETAMEFVKETVKRRRTLIIPYTNDKVECISTYWIYKLAKQFGVEIEG